MTDTPIGLRPIACDRLLPVLRLASGVLKTASVAGTIAGFKLPAGLPWVDEMGEAQEVVAAGGSRRYPGAPLGPGYLRHLRCASA